MTATFTPTPGIVDTTKNALGYMRGNLDAFWHYLKPYLPYLIGAHVFGLLLIAGGVIGGDEENSASAGNPVGELLAMYFMVCFTLTWYRVVVFGPQRTITVNPFKLQRSEIQFVLFGLGILAMFAIAILPGVILAKGAPALGGLVAFIMLGGALWLALRLSFYLPARAVGADITIKDAFALSKGYVWRIFACNLLVTLVIFVPLFLCALILGLIGGMFAFLPNPAGVFMQGLVMMPMGVILTPLMSALNATVLSNYYMHALQR